MSEESDKKALAFSLEVGHGETCSYGFGCGDDCHAACRNEIHALRSRVEELEYANRLWSAKEKSALKGINRMANKLDQLGERECQLMAELQSLREKSGRLVTELKTIAYSETCLPKEVALNALSAWKGEK